MSQSITYYGLDLGDYYSQLSFYQDQMAEPISISPIVGSEKYLIPTVIGKRPGYMQWYIGEEAMSKPLKVSKLVSKAIKREEVELDGQIYSAMELLGTYIRRVLQLSGTMLPHKDEDLYVICIDHASHLAVETLLEVCSTIGIKKEKVKICSRQESFCYYVMNQDKALRIHDVLLLDYWKDSFRVYQLSQDRSLEPTVVEVKEMQISKMSKISERTPGMTVEEFLKHKEACLCESLDEILSAGIISSMYLVGDGFDGDWMKHSIGRMCAGRRVFGGKNLYTKGACYYAKVSHYTGKDTPDYLYLGGGNLLTNVCIKAKSENAYQYKVLIPAGYNWQDAYGQMEMILRNMPGQEADASITIDVLIRSLKGEERNEKMELIGLSLEGDMPNRLRIFGKALSTSKVKITVEDCGFGQLKTSTNKQWNFEFRI